MFFKGIPLSSTVRAIATVMLLSTLSYAGERETARALPPFDELQTAVLENLPSLSPAEFNSAVVKGLLTNLYPRVQYMPPGTVVKDDESRTNRVSRSLVFEGNIGYLRIESVDEGLATAVLDTWKSLSSTNTLSGVIFDLRYTAGEDYKAAGATAALLVTKEQDLFDAGNGMIHTAAQGTIRVPAALLVNSQTAGAAEALAAVLRQSGAGLVLGSKTAGRALTYKDVPLRSGGKLRVATGAVRLADGSSLASSGLAPDIAVDIAQAEEKAWFADAFRVSTNLATSAAPARRVRFNEAELVRERREGTNASPGRPRRADPEKALVTDPALARAIDLLKGLAVLRRN